MDACKIRKGIYQHTAIDDCTRFKVMALYPKRTAENTLRFLEKILEEMPFPIQRIQTDRGLARTSYFLAGVPFSTVPVFAFSSSQGRSDASEKNQGENTCEPPVPRYKGKREVRLRHDLTRLQLFLALGLRYRPARGWTASRPAPSGRPSTGLWQPYRSNGRSCRGTGSRCP